MSAADEISIRDLRLAARRRLPRIVFELLDAACEDDQSLANTIDRIRSYSLLPKVLRNVARRNQSTTLFGRKWASCFGIAPTGTIGILRKDIELALAEAAKAADIPMVLSGASKHTLERVVQQAPGHIWSQLYAATDPKITADLARRAADCGVGALFWTIDLPVFPKIDRFQRAGYGIPPRPPFLSKLEALLHPGWLMEYLQGESVGLEHWRRYVPEGSSEFELHQFYLSQRNAMQSWRELELLRKVWKGPLILKGVLRPADAVMAAELGADGVVVSNHGGFSVDRAPAAIDMLPAVVAAVGHRMTVMFDSGVRRGVDIALAHCLGAKFVFVGRATLFGATAYGAPGALRAIDILKDELDRNLGLLGCSDVADLDESFVLNPRDNPVIGTSHYPRWAGSASTQA